MNVEGKEFERVNSFKYLGISINEQNKKQEMIKDRICMGNRAYHANMQLIKSKLINRKSKITIYKTLIRPIITYGAEVFVMNKAEEEALRRFERRVIRKIYGPVKENDNWRTRTNEEINTILENEDIVRFIKSQRIRWLGHVQRMEKSRMPRRVMQERIYSTRRKGRPITRWVDDVIDDLRKLKVRRWWEIAQDRKAWRQIAWEAKAHKEL